MRSRRIVGATLRGACFLLFAAPSHAVVEELAALEAEVPPAVPPVIITLFTLDSTPALLEDNVARAFAHLNGRASFVAGAIRGHLGDLPRQQAFAVSDPALLAVFAKQRTLLVPWVGEPAALEARPHLIEALNGLAEHLDLQGLQALTDAFYDVRFAHRLRTEWIRDQEYSAEIARHGKTHGARLGQIPPALSARLGGQERAFDVLDGIASQLHDAVNSRLSRQLAAREAAENTPLSLRYLASGETGDVYKLEAGDEVFTLKIYREGSAAEEYRALQFFSDARDMKRGYAVGGGWLLSEYLARGSHSLEDLYRRGGIWVHEKLKPHGIVFTLRADDQRIDGILIDPGDIRHIKDMGNAGSSTRFLIEAGVMNLRRGLENHLENAHR